MFSNCFAHKNIGKFAFLLTLLILGLTSVACGVQTSRADYYLYQWASYYDKGDFYEAAKCFHRAAELGNADAQFALGVRFYQGELAIRHGLYKQSTREAKFQLAILALREEESNDAEAVKWLAKAAKQGHNDAKQMLHIVEHNISRDRE